QWEQWQSQQSKPETPASATSPKPASKSAASAKKKLSYLEAREYAAIDQRVEEAEQLVRAKRAELEDPANATDAARLVSAQAALGAAREALDILYAHWAELEKKSG